MKLASYKAIRPGWQGVANRLIQIRLRGTYSHNEVVFCPGDGVDHLMPDGTCDPVDGALWSVSSVAAERLPGWSPQRAGKVGGVRFKRIAFDPTHWDVIDLPFDPVMAAMLSKSVEGARYDWQLIIGYLAWIIPGSASRFTCSEFCAWTAGITDPWRFDPCVLHAAIEAMDCAMAISPHANSFPYTKQI